jgi:hypothetical protein
MFADARKPEFQKHTGWPVGFSVSAVRSERLR